MKHNNTNMGCYWIEFDKSVNYKNVCDFIKNLPHPLYRAKYDKNNFKYKLSEKFVKFFF